MTHASIQDISSHGIDQDHLKYFGISAKGQYQYKDAVLTIFEFLL